MNQRTTLSMVILGAALILAGPIAFASAAPKATTSSTSVNNQVFMGDHLHTMSVLGHRVFMTGHDGAGMSDDGGRSWAPMSPLNGADVMSWTTTSKAILAGGHFGLFKSADRGSTFKQIKFYGPASDVHAIGASGKYVYLGSPQVGLLISSDGGITWRMRNAKVGQGFMGSILVDPKNPNRIIAPDMSAGLVISTDGGLTWSSFGGPTAPIAIAWNSQNTKDIAAIGMMNGGISSDGGKTWKQLPLPKGAAAIAYSSDGKKLFVGVLIGSKGQIYSSQDLGKSWQTAVTASKVK